MWNIIGNSMSVGSPIFLSTYDAPSRAIQTALRSSYAVFTGNSLIFLSYREISSVFKCILLDFKDFQVQKRMKKNSSILKYAWTMDITVRILLKTESIRRNLDVVINWKVDADCHYDSYKHCMTRCRLLSFHSFLINLIGRYLIKGSKSWHN